MTKDRATEGIKDNDVESEIRGDSPSAGLAIENSRHQLRFGESKKSENTTNAIDGGPQTSPRRAAQDLPGASGGSRDSWNSMIHRGSPEQPDRHGTARHYQADGPAKRVEPASDLSGKEKRISPSKGTA
jgi:hypothetical protein